MSAIRLYEDNAYIRDFEAQITGIASGDLGTEVTLDRTAFYPESGGQPCDHGFIADQAVLQVLERDGEIIHILASNCPLTEGPVKCRLDWERRYDLMQQHCGQHILSAALDKLFGAATVGFHLTEEHTQIDLAIEELTEAMIKEAEALANLAVHSPARIRVHFPDAAALAEMPLRKPPTVADGIRIVEVEDFDWSPCCGTHPGCAAEVGLIKIIRVEKVKKQSRVEFLCGQRAMQDYDAKNRLLLELSAMLSIGTDEIPAQISRLQDTNKQAKKELQEVREKLLRHEADQLLAESADPETDLHIVSRVFPDRPTDELRLLAGFICAYPSAAAILAGTAGDSAHIILARSKDLDIHMGEICKQVAPFVAGRGGGSPQMAQCGGNDLSGLPQALATATELIVKAKL
jgi:alanyl-tRNA synthetase